MNNPNIKAPSSNTPNSRTIIPGKLKKLTKQLPNVQSTTKKPFLKEYSLAMEQKLQTLKDKISEKKKEKTQQQSTIQLQKGKNSHLQKFLKTKTQKQQKPIQDQLIKQQFLQFLSNNNLLIYQNLLLENQIDSLQILAEATQKQLEEIGIPKGHSLKLKVNISKWMQANRPDTASKSKEIIVRENRTKDSDRNHSFVESQKGHYETNKNNNQNKNEDLQKEMQSICIGTEQDGMEPITFVPNEKKVNYKNRTRFCLFCYQSIKENTLVQITQFCSQDCLLRYNQMFKKYENNLLKAEKQFKASEKTYVKQNNQQQENVVNQIENSEENGFDFLDGKNQFYDDFDYQSYEQLKRELDES